MTVRKNPPPPPQTVPLTNGLPSIVDDPTGWNDVLGQLDGADDIEVHIYAEPDKGNGGSAWCFSCSPDDYTWSDLLTRIKNDPDLGPGRYSLRAKRGTQFVGRKVVQIAGRSRPAVLAPAVAAAPVGGDPMAAFREFQMQQMTQMQNLLLGLVGKMGNGGGASITDVITAAKMLTEGKRDPVDPIIGIKQLLEVQALLKAAADGSGESMGAGTMDAIVKALEVIGPVLTAGATAPAAPLQTLPSRPDPASSVPTVVATEPASKPKPKPDPMRVLLSSLIRAAKRESEVGAYAQIVIDELGDEQVEKLLSMPAPLDLLARIEPRLADHRAWFEALLTELREAFASEPDDDAGGLTTVEGGSDPTNDDPAPA